MTLPIGLIVNPIAGMGGAVGLHGTDGAKILAQARARGATARAGARAERALVALREAAPDAALIAAPGAMGADLARHIGLSTTGTGAAPGSETSAEDTRKAARAMALQGVATILFAGGDGTARDIAAEVGLETPILGIPSGVKMQSGVFASSPEAAGRLVADLWNGVRIGFRKVEVMDIDEDARRAGRLGARLYGYARAPHNAGLLQAAKSRPSLDEDAALDAACVETARGLDPATTWLIGPGTTAKRVLEAFGETGTLLGVDALRDGTVVGRDLSERDSLALAGAGALGIIVGVTGGQGFVFGRGNQQIGPEAIRRAWPDRLIVLAGEGKLAALGEPRLLLDTGDRALDETIAGFIRVRTGPRRATLMRLCA